MAKIFRKIRFQLFKPGQASKYLKYAVGEILLVVIGILIAVQINNWNQNSKNKKTINTIFQEIKDDLADDIEEANFLVAYYNQKDSLISQVLANKLTLTDYQGPSKYRSLSLTSEEPSQSGERKRSKTVVTETSSESSNDGRPSRGKVKTKVVTTKWVEADNRMGHPKKYVKTSTR